MTNHTIAILSNLTQGFCRDESGPFTFYVYAGQRSTSAKPRSYVPSAEIDRVIGFCHAQGVGSFS